ncbi:hypothetical protein ETAA1_43990 [Urbifossiella limnaea]|uniref:Uncharacterized protein n=1 Tax=Urbifossiella limnaea TaxID=2528023 RepID=A0A517XY30_9BACT|nr:hypothetical protein ETAA1_43990 [Urbifossiella limnaea]
MRKLLICLALLAGVVTVTSTGCKSTKSGCSTCGG